MIKEKSGYNLWFSSIFHYTIPMNILGIHTGHDASWAMIKDGRLVLAVSMERYSGLKKSSLVKMEYLERFLWDCKVQIEDIECIYMGFWDQSSIPFMRIYSPENENYPLSVFGRYNMDVAILNHLDNYPHKRDNCWFIGNKWYDVL